MTKINFANIIPTTDTILTDLKVVISNATKELLRQSNSTPLNTSQIKQLYDIVRSTKEIAQEERRIRNDDLLAQLSEVELLDIVKGMLKANPGLKQLLLETGDKGETDEE